MSEASVRRSVRERANGLCERCGQTRGSEAHHRKNRSQGGLWAAANILLMCTECHRWVTINPAAAREGGWALYSHQDPEQTPVKIMGHWMLLKNDGTVQWA